MSLKQIILRSQLHPATDNPMEIPGEPMIYSLKYPVGKRTRGVNFFRNKAWRSQLRSFFRSFYKTDTPCVLIVRFFVSPPAYLKVLKSILKAEKTPAVRSFELCDYSLSFMESLHKVLFNSYKQIVKLDVEKIYSANPRTVVQFMTWNEYAKLQDNNTIYAKTKGINTDSPGSSLQSQCERNASDHKLCSPSLHAESSPAPHGPRPGDCALRPSCILQSPESKPRCSKPTTAPQKTRRRQLGEILK